jgi:hypothetical protein
MQEGSPVCPPPPGGKAALMRREGGLTIITRINSGRRAISPTQREWDRRAERRRKQSAIYHKMTAALQLLTKSFNMSELLTLAAEIGKHKGVNVDRSARREKECLICWFCKNCSELIPRVPVIAAIPPPDAASSEPPFPTIPRRDLDAAQILAPTPDDSESGH